jgi:diguanylate cyclase (GGDEF)-like protein
MMVISMIITIISELSFTLYSDVYGAMNFLGHVLKAVSFIIIYNGVIKVGIENPYDFIFRELKASSSTDYLTGLHNRDGFYEKVEKLAKLAMEKDTCVGILLVDFDNFKKMNDSYGHLFGDEVLKKFGILIRDIIRKEDIVCRFGGDEFILLTTAAEDELGKIKERLTGRVEEWIKSDERLRGLGLSMGLAVCKPGQELNIERLIEKADRDMYRNKKGKPGNGDKLSEYFLS